MYLSTEEEGARVTPTPLVVVEHSYTKCAACRPEANEESGGDSPNVGDLKRINLLVVHCPGSRLDLRTVRCYHQRADDDQKEAQKASDIL
jgi:hypothetical protein